MRQSIRGCLGGLSLLIASFFLILLVSCFHVNIAPVNIAVANGGKEFLLEGVKVDKWKVNDFLIRDYCRDGVYRDINLTFGAEDTTAALNVLYAAQERFEPERTFRIAAGGKTVKFKRYLIDDPLIPLFNCYVLKADEEGRLGEDVYYLNDLAMTRWHRWWEGCNYVAYQALRMPGPDRAECVVKKLTKGYRLENPKTNGDVSVLLVVEGDVLLSRIVETVAELSERFGRDVYLMCDLYGFNEWLAADFPGRP